jgi:transcriptional regulator with XRE-family HTH domain
MATRPDRTFGQTIRERRYYLGLTQQEIGRRIKTSTPYIGHLEAAKRHPSDKVLERLADALGLDHRELYLIANPRAAEIVKPKETAKGAKSSWKDFRQDRPLREAHNITPEEMKFLAKVAAMGELHSKRDLIFVLNAVRHAVKPA